MKQEDLVIGALYTDGRTTARLDGIDSDGDPCLYEMGEERLYLRYAETANEDTSFIAGDFGIFMDSFLESWTKFEQEHE